MLHEGLPLATFYLPAGAYGLVALVLAAAPMWVFIPTLGRARRDGLREYGAFAGRYCDVFEREWFPRSGEAGLTASEPVSGLADLEQSFDVGAQLQSIPWSRKLVAGTAVAVVIPMMPLILREVTFTQLMLLVIRALAGHLPA
jgi:hypothetical protein